MGVVAEFSGGDAWGGARVLTEYCLVCGMESTQAAEYVALGGKCVCSKCANVIANIYEYAHSGKYLTWPNPPTEKIGFQKREIPEGLRWQVFERDGFQCKHCGSRRYLRADHIIAESKGGPTTIENLQTLCRSCNSKKGAR